MRTILTIVAVSLAVLLSACDYKQTSNDVQRDQSERILAEGTAQVGMPAIKNFRERKLLKDIFELRDQAGLVTYTYVFNEFNGKLNFLCNSIGYGIPYATQFTSPEAVQSYYIEGKGDRQRAYGATRLPQADPNGLFSPASAEGTWVLCKDPNGKDKDVRPVYVEPRIVVSPFKMTSD